MKGRPSPTRIVLTRAERAELEHRSRSTKISAGASTRAKVILLFVDTESVSEVGRLLQIPRISVRKWITRFQVHRLDGLVDAPRSGRPPAFFPGDRDARRQDRVRKT